MVKDIIAGALCVAWVALMVYVAIKWNLWKREQPK